MRDGVIILSGDGTIIEANPAACRMHGWAREAFIGKKIDRFLFPEDVHLFRESAAGAVMGGEFRCETREVRSDGTLFPVEVVGSAIHYKGERHVLAVLRDITERRCAAEQIEQVNRMAAALSEAFTPAEVARIAVEQGCLAARGSAASVSLLSEDGNSFEMLASTGYPEEMIQSWRRYPVDAAVPMTEAWRTGEAVYLENWAQRVERFPVLRHVAAHRGTAASACIPLKVGGTVVGVIGISFDEPRTFSTTERDFLLSLARQCAQALERARLFGAEQRARAEAEQANEAKSEFLAVLSHELRTPLTPALLTVSLLESSPTLPPELLEDVTTLRRNIELESRLIGDLLDLTRIAKGKLQLDEMEVDLHLLIRSAVDICRREASAKLVLELDAKRHVMRGDSTRLQQVFWNLVTNAQKFTPLEGTITIRTTNTDGGRIRIAVSDDGAGIEAEVLPRLFNAFEQGNVRAARQQAGLGLGLAISKRLAEAHGGTIAASSDGRGKGSTFVVELPTLEVFAPRIAPAHHAPATGRTRSLRVLLVEDHEPTLRIMTKLLRQLGHDVTATDSVVTGIAAGQAGTFDVLISDLGLPDGSGLDVMRELADRYAGKGIALTGYGMESDVAASEAAGFSAHLTKPVDLSVLKATMDRIAG